MARKVITHKIKTEGRDKNKLFLLTEMSASKAEWWAIRVFMGLMSANVEIPPGLLTNLGMAALAEFGMRALSGLKPETLRPLLDEMMECVQIIPDPKVLNVHRPLIEEPADVEEILTLFELRKEVWTMHTGFLQAVAHSLQSTLKAAALNKSHTETSVE